MTGNSDYIIWIRYFPRLQQYTSLYYFSEDGDDVSFKQERRSSSPIFKKLILRTCLHNRFDFLFKPYEVDFEFDNMKVVVYLKFRYKIKIFIKSLFYRI